MLYTIENKVLKIAVDTSGAQLQSVYSKATDTEYLWQGDSAYWSGRAYNLFPTIGRMYKNTYTYGGSSYSLLCHGIARYCVFQLVERTASRLVFRLTEDEDSLKAYPFRFRFDVCYEIKGSKLTVSYAAENAGEKQLICAFGGHPGFNVPFAGGNFENYRLEFAERTPVVLHTLSEDKFMTGETIPAELENGTVLALKHELFDDDAIIFGNTCRRVALKNDLNTRSIVLDYADFKYLGIWHTPKTDAPFVCLEPWSALPAKDGVIDKLEEKADMFQLKAGERLQKSWSLELHE